MDSGRPPLDAPPLDRVPPVDRVPPDDDDDDSLIAAPVNKT